MSLSLIALIVGIFAAVSASLLHLLIFWLEAFAWESPLARSVFGGSAEDARPHAFYAFNQGFYNLFLAIEVFLGAVLVVAGGDGSAVRIVGYTLALFGTASMCAAAVVLGFTSKPHRMAAFKQGTLPAIAVASLALSLA